MTKIIFFGVVVSTALLFAAKSIPREILSCTCIASKRADNIAKVCTACEECKEHSFFSLICKIVVFFDVELIRHDEDVGVKSEPMNVLVQTLDAAYLGDICSRFFLARSLRKTSLKIWCILGGNSQFRGSHTCDCLPLGLRDVTREGGS